ncbi:hypothetical protein [Streptomyces sp. NPDC085932]|uniref:hypothetical protein n=1 Tax=Streptomyces sp. NPDC085932 TaxID=3365741 RepID=UPI0037D6DF3D
MVAMTATPSEAHHVYPGPTTQQIMADCTSGLGKCTFGDGSPVMGESPGGDLTRKTYIDNWRRVSNLSPNCMSAPQRKSISWSQTTGTSDTFGISFKVEVGAIVKTGVETKYEHSWMEQKTVSDTYHVDVKPGTYAWIKRGQVMQAYTGKWRTHYDDPKWGHYYWATSYDTVRQPAREGQDGLYSEVGWDERPMTREEILRDCPNWYFPPGVIDGGTTLKAGWQYQANLTRLVMQSDGNLVMYRLRDNKAIWASRTHGNPGAYAVMQKDGNFVIYDASNRFLWHTNTYGHESTGAWAVMQNDGNFVIYKSNGGPGRGGALWASNTTAAAQ